MSQDAILRLSARLPSHYLNGSHRQYLIPDFNDMAAVAQMTANNATSAADSATAASGALATMIGLGASAYGIGIDGTYLVRAASLGSAAFASADLLRSCRARVVDSNYQIVPHDFGVLMLLTTSGTRTYTLPAWADMPEHAPLLRGKNRSGNNLTLNPGASDAINGGSTGAGVTVPTGSSYDVCKGEATGAFEVRITA